MEHTIRDLNDRTDKNTNHSYLSVYNRLFSDRQTTANHLLEIGIAQGGSIHLWRRWFSKAMIYAVDIYPPSDLPQDLSSLYNVLCFPGMNAYTEEFLKFLPKNFDVIIDDGSHTLEDQKKVLQLYAPLLAKKGILVIEDVQAWEHMEELRKALPEPEGFTIELYDLRANKGRADDLLFVIKRV